MYIMITYINITVDRSLGFLHTFFDDYSRRQHMREEGQETDDDAPDQRERQHGVWHEHYEQHVPDLVLRVLEADTLAA